MAEVEKVYRSPLGVTAEDAGSDGVRVCIVLPGLTKKAFGGKTKAKNGHVEVEFSARSLDVKVEMETKQSGAKRTENYRYFVKRLPDDVLPEKCRWAIEKDKLVVHLHKVKARPWAAELDQSGLETDRPEGNEDMDHE